VTGVPPPKVVIPPVHHLAMPFRHHNIFGQFIFWKIITTVATRGQILRLKSTKFYLAGAPPQTPLGELTAIPQNPSLDLRGLLLGERKNGEGREREERREREGKGGDRRGRKVRREGKGRKCRVPPPTFE